MEVMALTTTMAEAGQAAGNALQWLDYVRQEVLSTFSPTVYPEIDETRDAAMTLSTLLEVHLSYLQSYGNLLSIPGTNAYNSGTALLAKLIY